MGSVPQFPQRCSSVKTGWNTFSTKGFSPWENAYHHCHVEKMANNAGNEERTASSVSGFCITSHSGVWIHDSTDKAQLPHTFSTTSQYKSFTIIELHCGNQTLLLLKQHHWMLLDLKWLTWIVCIPKSLHFVKMDEFIVLQ